MTDVQNELENAIRALSIIPVSGDCVDCMAAARQHLRRAIKLCKSATQDEGRNNG